MIHVNQKGYSQKNGLKAVYQCSDGIFLKKAELCDTLTGTVLMELKTASLQKVPGWKGRFFQNISAPEDLKPGRCRIQGIRESGEMEFSENFTIGTELVPEKNLFDLLVYFKGMRSDGIYDEADKNAPVWGQEKRRDVRGGWYDASGDTSKYLSHLSYAGRMSPQQTPLVVWILADIIRRYDSLALWAGENLRRWMVFEMIHGADFLLRMQDSEGWFYKTLFDRWSKDPQERILCSYKTQEGHRLDTVKAGFREGGGMACAALAAASLCVPQEKGAVYRKAAESGYAFLKKHNHEVLEGGAENLLDWYCGLSASTALHRCNPDGSYASEISFWVEKITSVFHYFNDSEGWWFVHDSQEIPFYHASDEGLLLIALAEAVNLLSEEKKGELQKMLDASLLFIEKRLLADPDPFYYPRHWVSGKAKPQLQWFYPHKNPSGYWWQGENSRLSSLGAAVLRIKGEGSLGVSMFDWQLGLNPFNISMVEGWGAANPEYEGDYYNLAGGVANGITSGFEDEQDISFQPELPGNPGDNTWRWGEQWIPHAAWFMLLCSELREKKL